MKIIYNNIIPFGGFKAINLFGVLFVKKGKKISDVNFNHERIHTKQMIETLFILFYLMYFIEWLIRSVTLMSFKKGYYNISFEREAYDNQGDFNYLKDRKFWSFFKYYTKNIDYQPNKITINYRG